MGDFNLNGKMGYYSEDEDSFYGLDNNNYFGGPEYSPNRDLTTEGANPNEYVGIPYANTDPFAKPYSTPEAYKSSLNSINEELSQVRDNRSKLQKDLEAPEEYNIGELASSALLALVPAIAGYAIGGARTGAIGAAAGIEGLGTYTKLHNKDYATKREAVKEELADTKGIERSLLGQKASLNAQEANRQQAYNLAREKYGQALSLNDRRFGQDIALENLRTKNDMALKGVPSYSDLHKDPSEDGVTPEFLKAVKDNFNSIGRKDLADAITENTTAKMVESLQRQANLNMRDRGLDTQENAEERRQKQYDNKINYNNIPGLKANVPLEQIPDEARKEAQKKASEFNSVISDIQVIDDALNRGRDYIEGNRAILDAASARLEGSLRKVLGTGAQYSLTEKAMIESMRPASYGLDGFLNVAKSDLFRGDPRQALADVKDLITRGVNKELEPYRYSLEYSSNNQDLERLRYLELKAKAGR